MASIDDKNSQSCASNRNSNNNPTKSKKSNRKHKSKSLIVPSTLDLVDDDGDDGKNGSRSAGCDSSGFDFRHRFSFCSFRRGRSLSKTRLNDSTSTTPEPGENGPILIVNHVDDTDTNDTIKMTTTNQQSSIRKSRSVVDFRSLCSKLHRHLTIGTKTHGH